MGTNEQAVVEIEAQIRERHAAYGAQLIAFLGVVGSSESNGDKQKKFFELVRRATDFANMCEQSVGDTSLLGAHKNEAWAQSKAETSLAALETILETHQTLVEVAPKVGLSPDIVRPSPGAYASLQRLVSLFFPEHSIKLRRMFEAANLPVAGFEVAETEHVSPARQNVLLLLNEWRPFYQQLQEHVATNPGGFFPLSAIGPNLTNLETNGARLIAEHVSWLAGQWAACGFRRRPPRGSFERVGLIINEVPVTTLAEEIRERLAILEVVEQEIVKAEKHATSSSREWFHVLAKSGAESEAGIRNDLTREQLVSEVVEPLLARKSIRIDGHVVTPDMQVIKIVRTDRSQETFAREHDLRAKKFGISDLSTSRRKLPFEAGEDVTSQFLGSLHPRPPKHEGRRPADSPEAHMARVHITIVWLFTVVALATIAAGIVALVVNASGNTRLDFIGFELQTASVAVACLGIGVLCAFLAFRSVLRNMEKLEQLKVQAKSVAKNRRREQT